MLTVQQEAIEREVLSDEEGLQEILEDRWGCSHSDGIWKFVPPSGLLCSMNWPFVALFRA